MTKTLRRGRPGWSVAAALIALAVTAASYVTTAGPASASTQSFEIYNVDSTAPPRTCMQVLAHPATLINSAVVTGTGCDDNRYNTKPVAARLRWFTEGAGVANRWEFATTIPGHNNLCAVEHVATNQVLLNVCPIYTSNPSAYKNRMWFYRNVTDLDGREAAEVVNAQTGRCMAVPFANAIHNDNIFTEKCASTKHYDLRQLWTKRIAPGTG